MPNNKKLIKKQLEMQKIVSGFIPREDLGNGIVQGLPLKEIKLVNATGKEISLLDAINSIIEFQIQFYDEYIEYGFNKEKK